MLLFNLLLVLRKSVVLLLILFLGYPQSTEVIREVTPLKYNQCKSDGVAIFPIMQQPSNKQIIRFPVEHYFMLQGFRSEKPHASFLFEDLPQLVFSPHHNQLLYTQTTSSDF